MSQPTSCLVNNYNYAGYVQEAVDSVLAQTTPVDEILVVDDGSSDGSVERLERLYGSHPRVRVIAKENGGQLSCFQEGFARARGDLLFFLDADDVWEPEYVATVLGRYRSAPYPDFVFCGMQRFGAANDRLQPWTRDRDLGYSVALAVHRAPWIGTPTSGLSMTREILDSILPLSNPQDWRTRADDCLVLGSGLVGARKAYIAAPLVRYRVHQGNRFHGQPHDGDANYRHALAVNRLRKELEDRMGWDRIRLLDLAHLEIATIPDPTRKEFWRYARLCMRAPRSWTTRVRRVLRLTVHHPWVRLLLPVRRPSSTEFVGRLAALRGGSPRTPGAGRTNHPGRAEAASR